MTARTGSDHFRPTLGPWSAGLYLIDVVGTRWTTLASHPEPFMAGDWFGTPVWPMSSFHSGIGLLPQRELRVLGPSSSPRPTADEGGSFSPRIAALTGLGPIHGTPCGARAAGPHRSVRALGPLLSATLPEGAQPFTREGCPGRKNSHPVPNAPPYPGRRSRWLRPLDRRGKRSSANCRARARPYSHLASCTTRFLLPWIVRPAAAGGRRRSPSNHATVLTNGKDARAQCRSAWPLHVLECCPSTSISAAVGGWAPKKQRPPPFPLKPGLDVAGIHRFDPVCPLLAPERCQ